MAKTVDTYHCDAGAVKLVAPTLKALKETLGDVIPVAQRAAKYSERLGHVQIRVIGTSVWLAASDRHVALASRVAGTAVTNNAVDNDPDFTVNMPFAAVKAVKDTYKTGDRLYIHPDNGITLRRHSNRLVGHDDVVLDLKPCDFEPTTSFYDVIDTFLRRPSDDAPAHDRYPVVAPTLVSHIKDGQLNWEPVQGVFSLTAPNRLIGVVMPRSSVASKHAGSLIAEYKSDFDSVIEVL